MQFFDLKINFLASDKGHPTIFWVGAVTGKVHAKFCSQKCIFLSSTALFMGLSWPKNGPKWPKSGF